MKPFLQAVVEIALFCVAAVFALILRENFFVDLERWIAFAPYVLFIALSAGIIFPVAGLHRTIWRLSTMTDFQRTAGAVVTATVVGVVLAFVFNRLDGVARSLPVLHIIIAASLLISVRVIARQYHQARIGRRRAQAPLKVVANPDVENILVVGLTPLAESYVEIVSQAPERLRIIGLLGRSERQVGRSVGALPVLGVPQDIASVITSLETHGVALDRIVVTVPFRDLPQEAVTALVAIEEQGGVPLLFLADELVQGAGKRRPQSSALMGTTNGATKFEFNSEELTALGRRRYWGFKRAFDLSAAVMLLLLLWPVLIGVAIVVALTIGRPITFWQQRPGLGGVPFRVYKFRTMRAARDASGNLLSDDARTSTVGAFLRSTRLDELPQLLNIVRGEMSFVGPRPLLPRDQSDAYRARLLVRPGLTGWAQVVGGRAISAEDKAALDVWYVRNASFRLDLEIALRTVFMVLWGEKTNLALVRSAWQELAMAGITGSGAVADRPLGGTA